MPPNNNRQIVLYKQLISMAHQAGLVGVSTEMLQIPTPENGNIAIFQASVTMEQAGRTKCFQGTGDASPANVSAQMTHCLIRLAETRAIARALRIAVNVGDVADAELAEYDERRAVAAPARRQPQGDPSSPITDIQRAAIESLARRGGETVPNMEGWTTGQAGEAIKRLQQKAA